MESRRLEQVEGIGVPITRRAFSERCGEAFRNRLRRQLMIRHGGFDLGSRQAIVEWPIKGLPCIADLAETPHGRVWPPPKPYRPEIVRDPNCDHNQEYKSPKGCRGVSQCGDSPTRHTCGCSAYGAHSRPTRPPNKGNRCDGGKNTGGVEEDEINRIVKAPVLPP